MDKKRLEIDITLSKDTGIFNEFNSNQLSEDLSNYIYYSCKGYSIGKNITINIFHDYEISDKDKQKIIDAIRSNFGIDIRENNIKFRYEITTEIILVLIGSVFIVLSQIIDTLNTLLLDEIISIFGCMIIWEVAYNIIFNNTRMYIENRRLRKLTEARINFKYKRD